MIIQLSKKLNNNFGVKVFISFTFLVAVICFIFSSIFYQSLSKAKRNTLLETGQTLTSVLSRNDDVHIAVFSETPSLLEGSMNTIIKQDDVLKAAVFNGVGKLIKSQEKYPDGKILESNTGPDQLQEGFLMRFKTERFIASEHRGYYSFWQPLFFETASSSENELLRLKNLNERRHLPIGFVMIMISKANLNRQIDRLQQYNLIVACVSVVVACLIIYMMVHNITTPLNRLTVSVKTLETRKPGTLIPKVPVETHDEIGKLAKAINHMSATLQRREEALTTSEKRLRLLSTRLISAQEDERKRVAMELHDGLGQTLALLKHQVRSIGKNTYNDSDGLKRDSDETIHAIDEVIESVRRISKDLSPSILEDLGLSAALRWLLENFEIQHSLLVTSEINDIDDLFSKDAQINIFRLFQEALTNIDRHADAGSVSVLVKRRPNSLTFTIIDDGNGFDVPRAMAREDAGLGMGLTAMGERAHMLGANLDIQSQEGEGTTIELQVTNHNNEEKQWTHTA